MTPAASKHSNTDDQLPEGWARRPLGELGAFSNGINKPKEAFGSGHPFVNLMDVFGIPEISSTDECGLVVSTDREKSRYSLSRGDVLFVRSSVKPSGVGLSTVVTHDLSDAVFSGFLLRFRNCEGLDEAFKRYCFHAEYFRSALIANSTVSANTNINQGALKRLPLVYPTLLAEQNRIASALKDIDDLIASLDALIAKKRDIKQAAMQQLLTGKTRLPGFEGVWSQTPLGLLGKWRGGATPSMRRREFWEGGHIPWASSADVRIGPIYSTASAITDRAVAESSTTLLPSGSIAIVTRSGILRRFLPVGLTTRPTAINQDIKAVFPIQQFTSEFIFHALVAASDEILASCMKSGTTVESIELTWLKRFEIAIPEDREEQAAIASVFTEMDQEILALTAKQRKMVELKDGMMQQLLTGRIRLG